MSQKFLSVKNFEKYQHFKKANPPWIKLYKSMFGDRAFMQLPLRCKYLYIGLLTLCSEGDNRIVNDCSWIAHRLSMNASDIDLKPLYQSGFLIASMSTVRRVKVSLREETETETETEESRGVRDAHDSPPTPVVKLNPRTKTKTEWPEGFAFTERHQAIAEGFGLNVHQEFACFRDKAQANGWTYQDWNAAFRNWLNHEVKYKQARTK